MSLESKLITVAENQEKVYNAGKDAYYDFFWDNFQENGNRVNYICAFGGQWTTETFKPKYPIKPTRAYMMFFNNQGLGMIVDDFVEFCRENNIILDFSNCVDAQYGLACLWGNHFGVLDFSKCTGTSSLSNLFYSHNYANGVKKIDELIITEATAFHTSTFQQATQLAEITKITGAIGTSISLGVCPLNKASIVNVINALSATTTGKTVTFKKTSINTAFGINVDNESTYTTEWNTLRGSKGNWSFSFA